MFINIKRTISLILCVSILVLCSVASAAWEKSNERWWYSYADGNYACYEWLKDGSLWYYFDADGWMITGWKKIDGTWYYFRNSGDMATGWVESNGKWYYMNKDGKMQTGWIKDGGKRYYLNSDGAMHTGWKYIDNNWYYFNGSGAMVTGWVNDNGIWYYMNKDGKMHTGLLKEGSKTYYMSNSGAMYSGWQYTNNNWYYFDKDGVMVTDWKKVNGVWYYFNEKGIMEKEGSRTGWYTGVSLTGQKDINDDFVAWLTIPGTNVNYPVVSSDNVDWYLNHTFEGKKSKLGTLFSLGKCKWRNPSRNIVIYGHHVEGSGDKMFKALLKYKDESYYYSHPAIYLDSMYEDGKYRIFAVMDMTEGDLDPSKTSFGSNQEFMDYVNYAKKRSYYNTGVTVSEDDRIVTLVTCDRYFKPKKGRLVVMAVKEK